MTTDPKPVELTESEKADLIDAFQDGYLMSTDPLTSDLTQLGIVVTRIKAAARREALLEAAEALKPIALHDPLHLRVDIVEWLELRAEEGR